MTSLQTTWDNATMRPNPLRETLDSGGVAFGAWLAIPSPVTAEAVGGIGFDYVCIDMQHGLVDYSDSLPMLMTLTGGGATPAVRVPENHPSHIGKALDAGAMAIVVPMVNSVEACRAALAASRYAPDGERSYGPTRAIPTHGPDYFERANADVLCIPMIETVAALGDLDAILAVPGLEVIYVGPADLSISMGFGPDYGDPTFHDALDEIVAACARHNVVPGIHTNLATVQDRLERGFRMVTITSDLIAMRAGMRADLAAVRGDGRASSDSIY
jgi:4-hydroxy-2-oxoheptanedioate aldolase